MLAPNSGSDLQTQVWLFSNPKHRNFDLHGSSAHVCVCKLGMNSSSPFHLLPLWKDVCVLVQLYKLQEVSCPLPGLDICQPDCQSSADLGSVVNWSHSTMSLLFFHWWISLFLFFSWPLRCTVSPYMRLHWMYIHSHAVQPPTMPGAPVQL